jgi:hypothetical protein
MPPINCEKNTTVRALPRREANPPAKSPAPQARALASPQTIDMDSAGIMFVSFRFPAFLTDKMQSIESYGGTPRQSALPGRADPEAGNHDDSESTSFNLADRFSEDFYVRWEDRQPVIVLGERYPVNAYDERINFNFGQTVLLAEARGWTIPTGRFFPEAAGSGYPAFLW